MNGKMWRLLKGWYTGATCQVRLEEILSRSYCVGRGVKQGSVLSLTLSLGHGSPFASAGIFRVRHLSE